MVLVVSPEEIAMTQARALVRRSKEEMEEGIPQREILDLVETIIVYKLPRLSREEIQEMLGFTDVDLKETRFYQDVYAEAEVNLVIRQLKRRFGELDSNLVEQIQALGVSELEALAEALLDFDTVADLESWLQQSNV
jgi:predicted transposase YdaD